METTVQSIEEFFDQNGVNLRRETWDSWMKLQVVYWENFSAEQIKQVLGADRIQQISENVGVPQEETSQGLASLLPEIIDKLTPDGKVPESDMISQGLNILKGKLFGG